ncbi:MAG: hypothetical protein PHO32_08850, partial [Candidatus Cloacimonetes bacterium]|nr:hypothetical protein [Candidatus Cloacimonadota bacterium]
MKRALLILVIVISCLSLAAEAIPLRQTEAMVYNRSVANLSDGSIITVWDEARTDDYDIFAQRFNALGQALWSSPKPLFRVSGTQRNGILVPTVDSCFVALCWNGTPGSYANMSFLVQKFNSDGDPLWGNASLEFSLGNATSQAYSVIANPIGGINLVVSRGGSLPSTIAYSYDSSGNQLWGEEGLLLSNESGFSPDSMISDGSGGYIVNLKRYNPITNHLIHVSEQGLIIGNNPMLTESPFPGQNYSIQALTNGNILTYNYNADNNRQYIQVMDQSGNLLLTQPLWFYVDDGWPVPLLAATPDGGFYLCYPHNSNLHIVRVTAAGEIAWPNPGVTISGGFSNNFNLSVDASGNAIIVWKNLTTMTLKAHKISTNGSQLWTTNGITLNNECREPEVPALLSNANNTWFFWRDKIGASQFIHQQVLNSSGTPLLPFGGTAVLELMAGEVHLYTNQLAVNGYYYSFWHDNREGVFDIYMQKSDPNLNPMWEPNGKTFSGDLPGSKWMIDLMEAPNNQIAILYELYSANSDTTFVYMQLLNSSGEALYPGHGVLINNGYSAITGCYLSYDSGDYYVVWGTGGSSFGTVFGQRISNGQTVWGESGKVLLQANYGFSIADVISRFVILRLNQPEVDDTGHRLLKFNIQGYPETGWLTGGMQYFSDYDLGIEEVVRTIIKDGYLYVVLDGWKKDFIQKISMDGNLPWGLEGVTLHSPLQWNHGCQDVVFGDAIYQLYMTNLNSGHTSVYLQKATWDG